MKDVSHMLFPIHDQIDFEMTGQIYNSIFNQIKDSLDNVFPEDYHTSFSVICEQAADHFYDSVCDYMRGQFEEPLFVQVYDQISDAITYPIQDSLYEKLEELEWNMDEIVR